MKDRLQTNFAAEVARAPLHSPLGVWMRESRAELERMMRGARLDWDDLAQHFAKAKLLDHTGKPPDASTAQLIPSLRERDSSGIPILATG